MKTIRQLVYVSNAKYGLGDRDMESILAASRRNNRALDVTGLLIYADGVFIQVLEGADLTFRDGDDAYACDHHEVEGGGADDGGRAELARVEARRADLDHREQDLRRGAA